MRLDNVSFRRTRSASIVGTECLEPGGSLAPSGMRTTLASGAHGGVSAASGALPGGPQILQAVSALDLTAASSAAIAFESWLTVAGAWGEVQVRGDDGEWRTLEIVRPSDVWRPMAIDLSEYAGQVVDVRFVLYSAGGAAPEIWRIRRPGS
jgi:hypothetical protein